MHPRCRNLGCSCGHSRTADQMCRQQSRVRLTAEEQRAAEESFLLYCKPVELYNILQRRAIKNVSSCHGKILNFFLFGSCFGQNHSEFQYPGY